MDAGHLRQLFDQLRAFLSRDEFGRFHRINQQFQLRQSKEMTTQGIAAVSYTHLDVYKRQL